MTCILVVDDEPAVLKVLVTRLNLAGYQVLSAQDGEQALEVFHKEAPDLVVLDVMLPKMDGFAVCRRIRANQRPKSTRGENCFSPSRPQRLSLIQTASTASPFEKESIDTLEKTPCSTTRSSGR